MSEPVNNADDSDDSDDSVDSDEGTVDPTPAEERPAKTALLDELLAERPAVAAREPIGTPIGAPMGLGTRVGRIVEWTSGTAPKVEFEGNDGLMRGPASARSIVPLDPSIIAEAIQTERGVLLTFEDGRPDAPIITGLLQDFVDEAPQIWNEPDSERPEGLPAEQTGREAAELGSNLADADARIDGRRIELEAADEIVLRCGQASITLRRNGRVVIRGTYVESRSRGVNRIKGGSVEIN